MMRRSLYILAGLGCAAACSLAADHPSFKPLIIRSIRIDGNESTQPFVILREMSLHKGDTLTDVSLTHDRDRIYNLHLFNKVTVTHEDTMDSTDVLVTVVERWYIFPFPVFGIKFRDPGKLYYGVGVSHQNFRGRDEKLSASFSSGYDRSVSLTYQTPRLTDDDDVFLRASGSYRHVHNLSVSDVEYEQINTFGSLALGKRFGFFQTLVGTLSFEDWNIPDTSQGRTVSPDGHDKFLSLGFRYTYDTRDVREYPLDGTYLVADVTNYGFGEESTIKNFNYNVDLRRYYGFSVGSSFDWRAYGTFTAGGVVPQYHHVFLGFQNRLRGYFNQRYEGEDLLGGSAEFRLPVFAPRYFTIDFLKLPQFNTLRFGVYAGVFADVGKVWFRSDSFDDVPWLAGTGAGLHFLLPYSFILRTEFAVNDHGAAQIYIDFGASF